MPPEIFAGGIFSERICPQFVIVKNPNILFIINRKKMGGIPAENFSKDTQ